MSAKRIGWTLVLVLFMAGMVFAMQDAHATGGEQPEKKSSLAIAIVSALLGGALAAFIGWAKNRDMETGEHEAFDFKHAWPALVIGAIIGLVGHFTGKGPSGVVEMIEGIPAYGVIVFAAEAAWKAIFRNSAVTIQDALGAIKRGANRGNGSGPPSTPSS